MPTLANFIQHNIGSPSHSNQARKRNKRIPNWKEVKRLTLCRWHDTTQRKSYDATRKVLELNNEFSKVAGYKINIEKSVALLYTRNELPEREIKKTIPFTIASKRIKYIGINLSQEAKHLYLENYKTLMKKIEDNINRWKGILCSWIGINIVKMTILPKAIYRLLQSL